MHFYHMLDVYAEAAQTSEVDLATRRIEKEQTKAIIDYFYRHRPEIAKWWFEQSDPFIKGVFVGMADALCLFEKYDLPEDLAEVIGKVS